MAPITAKERTHTMSDFIKAVTAADFEQEVLVKSQNIPVLVDFWADWCAPCKQLMPILHGLVESLNGKVHLATVDTDAEQELAMQFGVRSLPTVVLVKNGEIVEQFMGAIPESEIRKLIEPHLEKDDTENTAKTAEFSENLAKAFELINNGQVSDAIAYLQQDSSLQAKLLLIKIHLQQGDLEQAIDLFAQLDEKEQQDSDAKMIKTSIELIQQAQDTDNKDLQQAIEETISSDPVSGIEQMLALLAQADKDNKQAIKKALITAFNFIDEAKLLSQLRRKMAALIF